MLDHHCFLTLLTACLLSGAEIALPLAPEVAMVLNRQPELAQVIAQAIAAGDLVEGETHEDLALSAVALQRLPGPEFAVPLLAVIRNRGTQPRAVLLQYWSARVHPVDQCRSGIMRRIGGDSTGLRDLDFAVIPAGGSLHTVLTAEPIQGAGGAAAVVLALDLPGVDDPSLRPEAIFSGRNELLSGPIAIPSELPPLPPVAEADRRTLAAGLAAWTTELGQPERRTALLRLGLYAADPAIRDATWKELAREPVASLDEDLLVAAACLGPSRGDDDRASQALNRRAAQLSQADEVAFLRRATGVLRWNWRTAFDLVSHRTNSGSPMVRCFCAETFAGHLERLARVDDWTMSVASYAIIYQLWGRVRAWRHPARAQALLARLLRLAAEQPGLRLLAELCKDPVPAVDPALIAAVDPSTLNSLAWDLVQSSPPPEMHPWSIAIAASAATRQPDIAIIDTHCAVLMAAGRLAEAIVIANACLLRQPDFAHVQQLRDAAVALQGWPAAEREAALAEFDYDHPAVITPIKP